MSRLRSIVDVLFVRAPGDVMVAFGMIGICLSVLIAVRQSPGQFPWDVGGGKGTQTEPYRIETCEQLQNISKDPSASYTLAGDIDCSMSVGWDGGQGLFPIGYYGNGFTGVLDGRGHAIRHLTIHRADTDYVALFGKLGTGAVVRDVQIDAQIVGRNEVGAIAGWSVGATVALVRVDGNITGSGAVGGIVGVNEGAIEDTTFHAGVRGKKWVGGIAGLNYEKSTIKNVKVSGDIAGDSNIGGVVGVSRGSTIDGCSVDANVIGVTNVGGAVGWLLGGSHTASAIVHCTFTGTLHGETTQSGVVGARGA